MIEGRPRESLVDYENPIEVSQKVQAKTHWCLNAQLKWPVILNQCSNHVDLRRC